MDTRTLKFIKSALEPLTDAPTSTRCSYIVNALYPNYIKCNYDPPTAEFNRMLLHSNRLNQNDLASECNGFIFDYKTLEPLCYPPELPTLKWDRDILRDTLDQYSMWKIYDGTIINLYRYDNRWCLSTGKGIDVGMLKWNGDGITYRKALDDVLAHYKIDLDSLEHSKCYTIGISHPDMHPYSTSLRSWFVCSFDFTTQTRNFSEPEFAIPASEKVEFKSWDDLQTYLRDSSVDNFGVIMRSQNPSATPQHTTVLLESTLMKNIRRHVYDSQLMEDARACDIPWSTYIVLYNFLDSTSHRRFRDLFPRYADDIGCLTQLLEETVVRLSKSITNPSDFETQLLKEFRNSGSTPHRLSKNNIRNFVSNPRLLYLWNKRWTEFKESFSQIEKNISKLDITNNGSQTENAGPQTETQTKTQSPTQNTTQNTNIQPIDSTKNAVAIAAS